MTKELQSCVVSGLLRCERPNASAALVNGPSLCQNGRVGMVFGVGTGSSGRADLVARVALLLV